MSPSFVQCIYYMLLDPLSAKIQRVKRTIKNKNVCSSNSFSAALLALNVGISFPGHLSTAAALIAFRLKENYRQNERCIDIIPPTMSC